jgi:ABC-2 type transport system permease protein
VSTVRTVVRKELRSYFLSPVAVIFLAVFLLVTLFVFFTYSRFFARNIADVRPLFAWLPVLLIFLVSAVTMRAWSEEEKIGTLEVLLTLPVRTRDLVLGKFFAGMVLVALALALTIALPITVSLLGDLDWGPVIGGYVGAMLLAATYMAIGLCVSSRTDNQIVSLMVTAVICGLFYLIGSDAVVAFFGDRSGELLRALGSGSRFASIERGMIDLRDIGYYASLTVFFLLLNVEFLELKRLETNTPSGRRRARARWATVALVAVNVVAFNVWMAPVATARADLTEGGEYSLSHATKAVLGRLDEPLRISGYFSDKTHPLLAPLVPQIRDMLREYENYGGGRVHVDFRNPNEDEALEEELGQSYDIKPVPFRVSGRHEESVVNSYFHILLRYADQYDVLSWQDLIELDVDQTDVEVRLRNLEYDLTRAIKQLTEGFQNIDAVFAGLDKPAKLTVYVSPATLPEEFKDVPARIRTVADDLVERSGGKFRYEQIDPTGDRALQQEIDEKYNFRPMAVSLFGGDRYYLYMLFQSGDHTEAIFPQGDLTEAALRSTIEASIKRATPGFTHTVAIFTEQPAAPPPNPNLPPQFQPPPPQADYRQLEHSLQGDFTVRRTELKDGYVPGDVDVLVVARPGKLDEKQKYAVDQYLMRGGAVVVLAGGHEIHVQHGGIQVSDTDSGLRDLLETYGVKIDKSFVLDKQNARFPVPIQERHGMFTLQRIHFMDYPFFVDVRRGGFDRGHPATAGLENVVLNWASDVELVGKHEGVDTDVLLRSSDDAWKDDTTQVLPASLEGADSAFTPNGPTSSEPLAVTMVGSFPSYFADKPSPLFKDTGAKAAEAAKGDDGKTKEANETGRTLTASTKDARLAVVGSSAFASDLVKSLGDQAGAAGGIYRGNFQLVRNLIDWALEDNDLLAIRSAGAFARTLDPMTDGQKTRWEIANYLIVLLALAAIVVAATVSRRRTRPMHLAGYTA